MEDNQINGQKISKEAYCPNSLFDNGTISIGEFKTLDDAMNFPIKEIWCINRTEDNKFQSYKSQGYRLLIICSWNRSIQDSLKFVVAVIHKDKVGKVYYWDMNDLPLYPEERKNQYEGSLGDDATYTLYQIANNRLNCNRNMNKKLIRLTESDLHQIVVNAVRNILKEEELRGMLLNAPEDSYERKEAFKLADAIDRKMIEQNIKSDSHHQPVVCMLHEAVLEMIQNNDFHNLLKYTRLWQRMLETNNFDTWS